MIRTLSPTRPPHTTDMQLVVLACLAAVAVAAPQELQESRPVVQILRDDRQDDGAGSYNFAYEADNGIAVQASGSPGSQGQAIMQGAYSFPLPDGSIAEVRYSADENGFQPQTDLLPTPHPIPAEILEVIRVAEELRAAGVTWDDQGRQLTR